MKPNPKNITNLDALNRAISKARAELADAKQAAKRERGLAVIEDRKPSKRVLDAPGKMEPYVTALEIRAKELPYELYAAESKRRETAKVEAEERLAEVQARTPKIEADYRAAAEASNAASRKYRNSLSAEDNALNTEAYRNFNRIQVAWRNHRAELLKQKTRAEVATESLRDLEESGPEGIAA